MFPRFSMRGLRVSRPRLIRKRHCVYSAGKQGCRKHHGRFHASLGRRPRVPGFLPGGVGVPRACHGRKAVQPRVADDRDECAARGLDAHHGAARTAHDRHRHHARAAARHGILRLERAAGDRRLLRAHRGERPGAGGARRLPLCGRSHTSGVRDQGDRADPASGLRLLQVRLVLPAVQLLLDPDRRGARASRRSRRNRPKPSGRCGAQRK